MTSAIIAYFPVAAEPLVSPAFNFAPLVNHRFGTVFALAATANPDGGLRKYDAWPNGNELVARELSGIGIGSGLFQPWCLTYNTQLLACGVGSSNSSGLAFIKQNDLTLARVVGASTSDTSPTPGLPGGNEMRAPAQCVSIQSNGKDYVICTTAAETHEVNVVNLSAGLCANVGAMTQTRGVLGALPDGSGQIAYVLGYNSSTTTANLSLYHATPTVLVKTKDYAPSDIDPTWSHVDAVWGIAVDQTDGNLLVAMENLTDTVTNSTYFLKLNAFTGTIMWKLVLPGNISFRSGDLQQALITQGKFYYVCTNATLAVVDTINGVILENPAFSAGALSGNHPGQVSEDVVGSVYFNGSWTETLTHPTYYGSYMGTGGNHAVANAPMRYFPDTGTPNPPAPAIEASSRQRAWTFTLDGHKFYVLDLGTEGTLLYDTTTSSWCQFVTTGYWNWNFRNGTMWGQRIVGGDTATPQIWEMSPSSMKDNGTLDVVHITTGGLIKRTRVYSSLCAVRLSVSVGDLDDSTNATVLLEYSDDQGQTWVQCDTLALMAGDFSEELAWRSLGSFAAPGRIFRITDVGGFVRIDGCDAEMDSFDEDTSPAGEG